MASISVVAVTNRRQEDQFLDLPRVLYARDANWVPPVRSVQRSLLGYRPHPFYKSAQARTFLAFRDGAVCGRVAAVLNWSHNEYHRQAVGFFGFFECIDDQDVANALLDEVREWFSVRGISSLCGPVNPGFEYTAGLLVAGFDESPVFLTTYNPPYYARLLETWGFCKKQDLLAYGGHVGMLPRIDARLKPVAEQIAERFQIGVRRLSQRDLLANIDSLTDIYNRSMTDHWGFVPISCDEVRYLVRQIRHLLVPEFTLAAEIDGRFVAFTIGLPDYNQRLKQIGGRLFPFGFLRLLGGRRQINCLRVLNTHVAPEYQRLGVPLVLLRAMAPAALASGVENVEFSWVLESNRSSRGSLEKGGANLVKRYRIYSWTPQECAVVMPDAVAAPARSVREAVPQLV